MTESTEFGIIVNDEHEFSVWRTECMLPPGWRFTGHIGTEAEMTVLFLQRFVHGTTGTHMAPDMSFSASRWQDTHFGGSQ